MLAPAPSDAYLTLMQVWFVCTVCCLLLLALLYVLLDY